MVLESLHKNGELIGENTDGKGFVSSLKQITDPNKKSCVIFGAGGAARAISVEMAIAGCSKITIINRSMDRGEQLVQLLNTKVKDSINSTFQAEFVHWNDCYQIPSDSEVVINATSIGLFPDTSARLNIDPKTLSAEMVVADVIPNPPKTQFVKDATERGCEVIDGLEMLVAQGVIGIEYWTGQSPDSAVMRKGLEDVFGSS